MVRLTVFNKTGYEWWLLLDFLVGTLKPKKIGVRFLLDCLVGTLTARSKAKLGSYLSSWIFAMSDVPDFAGFGACLRR